MCVSFRCFSHSHFKLYVRVTNFLNFVTLLPVSSFLSATSSDLFGHLLFRSFLRLCVFMNFNYRYVSLSSSSHRRHLPSRYSPHQFHFRSFQPKPCYTTSFVHCAACCLDILFPQECFSSPYKDRYVFTSF